MRDLYVIQQLASNVRSYLEGKTNATYTVTNVDVTNSTTTSLVFDGALPTNVTNWYTFSRIDFGNFNERVITSATIASSNVSWRIPLPESFTIPSTVTISSAPLSETAVFLGGGPFIDDFITNQLGAVAPHSPSGLSKVTFNLNGHSISSIGIGKAYGSERKTIEGDIRVFYSFPSSDTAADYATAQINFYRLIEQIESVLQDGTLLSAEWPCKVSMDSISMGYMRASQGDHRRSGWTHWAVYDWSVAAAI